MRASLRKLPVHQYYAAAFARKYPINVDDNLLYAQGALVAMEYLHKARVDMKMHRKSEPQTLHRHKQIYVKDKALEFQAGSMDVVGAFIPSSLDGMTVDLFRWDVLYVLAYVDKQK